METRRRRPADGRSRPQRWRDATAELLELQPDHQQWPDGLPESLADTPTADRMRATCDLDLSGLELDPPLGFGAIEEQNAPCGSGADLDEVALQPGTVALVPQVADAVSVPVIAAGGIADARAIAAAFALGAAGVTDDEPLCRAVLPRL